MLQLTEKSCEIYCLTIYAYFMTRTQVINHKLHISEVSFSRPEFYNLTTHIYGVCTSNVKLTNTNMTGISRERERERDCTVFAHESFVLAWFLRISIETQRLGQSANPVTTASDVQDPRPKLIVRVSFCTAKSDIPQYYMFIYLFIYLYNL